VDVDESLFQDELYEERVFQRRSSAAARGVLWLVGGITALGTAAIGLVVALVARVDPITLQLMTTLPILVGIGAIVSAWMMACTARFVRVGPRGVRIERRGEWQEFGWDDIGWSAIQPGVLNQRRQLKLYDVEGRLLARLSDAIADFDTMAELVKARIAAKGDETARRIQMAKAKRMAVFVAVGGLLLLSAACFIAWDTREAKRAERLLAESAIAGEAEIEDRFLAPNGITPRLAYRVTTDDGRSATRNAEMLRPAWDELEDAKTVAVIYVPDEPAISRLAKGEAVRRDVSQQPAVGYGLSAVSAVFGLVCLFAAVLAWRGWDIDFDSKTRRFSIKRYGTGR
jgi:hypothetical protein